MKKLILRPRGWPKALGAKFDNLFSGGVPFTPYPPSFPGRVSAIESMMGDQSERSFREALGAQQASYMGGLGGQLLNQLMGYRPYETKPKSILEEGKVDVQVKLTRLDKEHILVEVECIQRIVHNAKELRELTAKLIETHAEEFLFGEHARKEILKSSEGPKETREPEPIGR